MKFIDLTGQRFGMLTVIKRVPNKKGTHTRWLCVCDCGKECIKETGGLRNGSSTSCGCWRYEKISKKVIKLNEYDLSGEYGIGYTRNTNSEGIDYFYFDLEDYDKIKDYTWYFGTNNYLISDTIKLKTGKSLLMHRVIMGLDSNNNMEIDHIRHQKYDNRKKYLRIVDRSHNTMNVGITKANTSGATGVNFDKRRNKWYAVIRCNGQYIHLGLYTNKEDAIKARKDAEEKYYGEYSYDNSMAVE